MRGLHALVTFLAITAVSVTVFCLVSTGGLYGLLSDEVVNGINLALPWLIVLTTAWAVWKKLSYRCSLSFFAASCAFLVYMAWDDGTRPPAPTMASAIPPKSESYAAYRWMLKNDPNSRLKEIASPSVDLPMFPLQHEEWEGFVTKHRAMFEAEWAADSIGREWIEAMARSAPEGLFPSQGIDSPILSFSVIRRSVAIRWAHAQLLWLDGHGDEAIRTLVPILRAGYHLQRGSLALVNQMIASVLLKGTYDRLELIEYLTLSASARADLVAALQEAPPVVQNIAQAFQGEQIYYRSSVDQVSGDYSTLIKSVASTEKSRFAANRVLGRFLFNPARSEREYAAFLNASCRLAQQKQFNVNDTSMEEVLGEKRLKNPVGYILTAMAAPAFPKVAKAFWKAEDQRLALLKNLTP